MKNMVYVFIEMPRNNAKIFAVLHNTNLLSP